MKVRTDLLKIFKNLHTWVGIISGIFLFICFFAAAPTMFQHELSQWAAPPQQKLPSISLENYARLVDEVQHKFPETKQAFQLNFHSQEYFNAPMQWQHSSNYNIAQQTMLASFDQQGNLIVQQENVSKIGWLIEQLHETAGIPGVIAQHETVGLLVMGIICVLYFLAIMSGLILLLPTLIKDYFAIRKGKNQKRFWLDMHNVSGITSLPFHIIICITVIGFAFHTLFYMGLRVSAFKDRPLFNPVEVELVDKQPKLNLNQIFLNTKKVVNDYQLQSIAFNRLDQPEKATAMVGVYRVDRMLRGDELDYLFINPYQTTSYDNSNLDAYPSAVNKFIKSMFSLHYGNFGGTVIRWVYVGLALIGAFLFYSGNMLWINSRRKRQKNVELVQSEQKKSVIILEKLTIGACIGCILGIVSCLFIVRWLNVFWPNLVSINHALLYSYYAVFVISIVYAFAISARKALVHLLAVIVIMLFAIPLTSIFSYLFPQSMLWHHSGHLLWVDVVFVIVAFIFIRFYQMAQAKIKAVA